MSERYQNKRGMYRRNGRFAKLTASGVGLGECPTCRALTVRIYDGDAEADQRGAGIDPRKFRQRCFRCEPRTEDETAALEAARQTEAAILDRLFRRIFEDAK